MPSPSSSTNGVQSIPWWHWLSPVFMLADIQSQQHQDQFTPLTLVDQPIQAQAPQQFSQGSIAASSSDLPPNLEIGRAHV